MTREIMDKIMIAITKKTVFDFFFGLPDILLSSDILYIYIQIIITNYGYLSSNSITYNICHLLIYRDDI